MQRRRVLVVDDTTEVRELFARVLTRAGYDVTTAENGGVGLRLLADARPDAILLDYMMPEMDGPQFLRHLRARPDSKKLPVILLTGLNDSRSVDEGFAAGATDYLTKPVHRRILVERLRSLIARHGAEPQAERAVAGALIPSEESEDALSDTRRSGAEADRSGGMLVEGSVFAGDFLVKRPLSVGGMGAVYVVEQRSTGMTRALKLMRPELVSDSGLRKRFEQEARVAASISSEHVVSVLAAGVDAATCVPWLAMEMLDGEDLSSLLARGPLELSEVGKIFDQLCHAIGAAHRAGIVHRDLKPENIFMSRAMRAGASMTVKVLDFGIAKMVADANSNATEAIGSPMWMAPEQTTRGGQIRPQTDVWALGLIAFNALTGRQFWSCVGDREVSLTALIREIVLDPIPAASERAAAFALDVTLPSGFDSWFARCVARDPDARFSDADAANHALQRVLGRSSGDRIASTQGPVSEDIGAPPPPPAEPQDSHIAHTLASASPAAGVSGDRATPSAVYSFGPRRSAKTTHTKSTRSRHLIGAVGVAAMLVGLTAGLATLCHGGARAKGPAARSPTAHAPADLATKRATMRVGAYIDGRSELVLKGGQVFWRHREQSAPGRRGGADEPTVLDGRTWTPTWPDRLRGRENYDCNCASSRTSVDARPTRGGRPATVTVIEGRDTVEMIAAPGPANGDELVIQVTDRQEGAAWYEFVIEYTSVPSASATQEAQMPMR